MSKPENEADMNEAQKNRCNDKTFLKSIKVFDIFYFIKIFITTIII